MSTKFYADANGNYLGGFQDCQMLVPAGAIEVPTAPADARDKWDGFAWVQATPPTPAVVSMRQARRALNQSGLLAATDAAVLTAGGEASIDWEYATEVRRDAPLVLAISSVLGLTSEQLDDLFKLAATFDH